MRAGEILKRWSADSLRLRFLLAILLWVALGIGGIWVSATNVFTRHVEDQFHDELRSHVQELSVLVSIAPDDRPMIARPLSDPRYLFPLEGYYWQVTVDEGGEIRSQSLGARRLDQDVAHSSAVVHEIEDGPRGPVVAYGFTRQSAHGHTIHYVIAADKRLLDAALARFNHELSLWLAALAAALVGTGLAVIAFGLRPLDRLGEAIAALRDGRSSRLDGRFPAEIAPLAGDLNAYVESNAAIVARGRVQAGNLAHGLRTPLAVITDEAERLAMDPATSASGEALLAQAQAMAQQIEVQLARVRSAAGGQGGFKTCRLGEVLAPLLSAMGKLHPDKRFVLEGDAAVAVPVDAVDLTELLSILLDNAGKWARSRVVIACAGPVLAIRDDGAGMSAEQIAHACEIGTRFDPAMPGSGLGLAIARDIAESYGLALRLGPGPEGGLVAEIRFPA